MNAAKRREGIISMLKSTSFVKMSDIASHFNVSNETARRDLDYLQHQNIVRRIYGGAVLAERTVSQGPVSRLSRFTSELNSIGMAAADMVKTGDAVFIGPGSTTLQVARHLRNRKDITVVTNSFAVANELYNTDVTTYILGGLLSKDEQDIRGDLATSYVSNFYFDKVFLGCGGITMDYGVMDFSTTHSPIHGHVVKRSGKCILVASSKKFGTPAFVSACSLDDIHTIVTDNQLSEEYCMFLQERNIQLVLVEPSIEYSLDPDE